MQPKQQSNPHGFLPTPFARALIGVALPRTERLFNHRMEQQECQEAIIIIIFLIMIIFMIKMSCCSILWWKLAD